MMFRVVLLSKELQHSTLLPLIALCFANNQYRSFFSRPSCLVTSVYNLQPLERFQRHEAMHAYSIMQYVQLCLKELLKREKPLFEKNSFLKSQKKNITPCQFPTPRSRRIIVTIYCMLGSNQSSFLLQIAIRRKS